MSVLPEMNTTGPLYGISRSAQLRIDSMEVFRRRANRVRLVLAGMVVCAVLVIAAGAL